MRNKNFFITIFLMMFILFFTNNSVFASFADYTDEDAEKDTQQMIQEHEKNFDSSKSDNNYLESLIIEGKTLTPAFERQIVEYSLIVNNNVNKINIIAKAEDIEAKINGVGQIDITNISECKIDVISASGTTRTYFIRFIKEDGNNIVSKNESENNSNYNEEKNNLVINSKTIQQNELISKTYNKSTNNYLEIIILIAMIIIVSIIIIVILNKKKKRSKH